MTFLKEKTIESFMPYKQEVILLSINSFSRYLLGQAKSVSFDGVKYNSGECTVLSFHDDDYRFGLIDCVIFHNARVYLLCKSMEITKFEPHFNTYSICNSGNYVISDIRNIDYHQFGTYYLNKEIYVPLKQYRETHLILNSINYMLPLL